MARFRTSLNLVALGALFGLSGCQASASSNVMETTWAADGPMVGRVHHLTGEGLVIRAGGARIAIAAHETRFSVDPGQGPASIRIERQPAGQMCVVDELGERSADETVSIYCETLVTQPMGVEVNAARISPKADRIFAPVRVGDGQNEIRGLLDTGSAGVVLNAFQVFPATILTKDGFRFPRGSHRIAYDGMIVTDVVIRKKYGGKGDKAHASVGNLGFAQMTFGRDGRIVTGLVPVLFAYSHEDEKGSRPFAIKDSTANIIGINADVNLLRDADDDASGTSRSPRTPIVCDERVVTDCGLTSPFRKLAFASGIGQGFLLDPVSMSDCPLSQLEDCPLDTKLTIGITQDMTRGFVRAQTRCRTGMIGNRGSLSLCSQNVANITISAEGYAFRGSAIFDSGNPKTIINVPKGVSFPADLPDHAVLRAALGPDVVYGTRVADIGNEKLTINPDMTIRSCIGISFFEKHAYFMDYDTGMIGLR